MTEYYPKYDKITIGIVVNNKKERDQYFRLFKFMLSDKLKKAWKTPDNVVIETEDIVIDFIIVGNQNKGRGWRRHYILNLTQDKEFDDFCVKPKTIIFDYLKLDPKWSVLFEV